MRGYRLNFSYFPYSKFQCLFIITIKKMTFLTITGKRYAYLTGITMCLHMIFLEMLFLNELEK